MTDKPQPIVRDGIHCCSNLCPLYAASYTQAWCLHPCMERVEGMSYTDNVPCVPFLLGHHEHTMAQIIVDRLNDLLTTPGMSKVLQQLIDYRVPASDAIAEHPTVQVNESNEVGMLGILNGILGANEAGWGYLIASYDADTGELLRFEGTPDLRSCAPASHHCSRCGGAGERTFDTIEPLSGQYDQYTLDCPSCKGSGSCPSNGSCSGDPSSGTSCSG